MSNIVLRINKGSALTYDEMDRNQSQFFYSASLNATGTSMLLHYTGSSALDTGGISYGPRSVTIPFPSVDIDIPEAVAAGNDTEVQFNQNGSFGASSNLVFDRDKNSLGIAGSPTSGYKLTIYQEQSRAASIKLTALSALANNRAETAFFLDSNQLGGIGKTVETDNNLYFSNRLVIDESNRRYGKLHFSIRGTNSDENDDLNSIVATVSRDNDVNSVGIGTTNPNRQLNIVGAEGLGISATADNNNASYLRPIPTDLLEQTSNGLTTLVPGNSSPLGLLIASPAAGGEGGNVVVAVNTDNSVKEAFNIISVKDNNFSDPKTGILASFRVDNKSGIGTQDANLVGLTVAGSISSSLDMYIGRTSTASSYSSSAVVAVDDFGKVEKAVGALTPVGGIIMWSGSDVPNGWALCNGQTANGVVTPNLIGKFIMASGSADVNDTGGNATFTYSGTTGGYALEVDEIPAHGHAFRDGYHLESNTSGNSIDGIEDTGASNLRGDGDSDDDNRYLYFKDRTTSNTGGGNAHSHSLSISTTNHIPPFYALAYIMYVGT